MNTAIGVAFTVGVALLPVYLWSSGGLQISHGFIALACVVILIVDRIRLSYLELLLLALLIVVAGRELISTIVTSDADGTLAVAHTGYAVLVFTAMRQYFHGASSLDRLRQGLGLAVAVALAGVLLLGYGPGSDRESIRAIGTFNNPNQLGYFALLTFSVGILLRYEGRLQALPLVAICMASVLLSIASLSKAAMIAMGFGLVFAGYALKAGRERVIVGFVVAVTIVGAFITAVVNDYFDQMAFFQRLLEIGSQNDDSFRSRGYFLVESARPLELLFGLGASGVRETLGHEIHSTVFSYVGSYGLIGGALFGAFIFLWMLEIYRRFGVQGVVLVCLPVMLYGVTHNGSRSTLLWILIALSCRQARHSRVSEV